MVANLIKPNIMKKTVSTSDFYLASYLLARHVPMVGHERTENRSCFEFAGPGIDEIIDGFYDGDASVSPLTYAKAIRSLKNIMYNAATINIKSSPNNERTISAASK